MARGHDALREDEELRDATIYRLQTVAESTQRLSSELKTAHPRFLGTTSPASGIEPYTPTSGSTSTSSGTSLSDLPNLVRVARVELVLRRHRQGPVRDPGGDLGIDL
jgi:hypothetical protein